MPIVSDIAAIRARGDLNDDQKRGLIYEAKGTALLDVILNGKPAPQPIPALLGRTFTLETGTTVRVNAASLLPDMVLELNVTFNGSVTHTIRITNPPVLPKVMTGDEKRDLIQAATEMLEGFI